ncbi:hypothetical protein [Oricola sp.]|uniref:hypothetical protein n=1 Tax=Oricola sp. TaxID=1979950 RepID=UPI0025E3B665|nr:hypothetical protein [Oricola sp.]MCI5073484.1 hypothetical protein [Oricola sp.]
MRIVTKILALALAGAAAGCTTAGSSVPSLSFRPISGVLDSDNKLAGAALVSALNGGLLSDDLAARMGPTTRTAALQAEYQALEYTPAGESVAWGEAGASFTGEVVASQPYRVGSQNCRQYSHTVLTGGAPVTGRGTACRNSDGSWTPLT